MVSLPFENPQTLTEEINLLVSEFFPSFDTFEDFLSCSDILGGEPSSFYNVLLTCIG